METKQTNNTNNGNVNSSMCNGRCAECVFQQRVFCAAYMSRNNYSMMQSMLGKLDAMQMQIDEMQKRINAIQSNEGELMKPFVEEKGFFDDTDTMG